MSEGNVELDEQLKAVVKFAASISRPVIRWPWRTTREPKLHRQWRFYASVARRFELYRAAGLPLDGMTKVFFDIDTQEQIARKKWFAYKYRREMSYCTGKTKTPPPWDF